MLLAPAAAASLPNTGEFLYSSLCWDPQGGDAAGYQVRLARSPSGDALWLEWSEGPLYGPMKATALRIDPATAQISFTIPANTAPNFLPGAETYSGTISAGEITLNNDRVPRVKRLWHQGEKQNACR